MQTHSFPQKDAALYLLRTQLQFALIRFLYNWFQRLQSQGTLCNAHRRSPKEKSSNLSRQNGRLSRAVYAHNRFPVSGGRQLARRWGGRYLRNRYCAAGRSRLSFTLSPFRVRAITLNLLPYLIERSRCPSVLACLDVHATHATVKYRCVDILQR